MRQLNTRRPSKRKGRRRAYRYRTLPKAFKEETREPSATVLEGDAYDLLRGVPAKSVDLIITSPPYWGHRTYEQQFDWKRFKDKARANSTIPSYQDYRLEGGVLGLEPLPDWYVAHLAEILDAAQVCLKPHGNLWINVGDTYFSRWSSIRQRGRQGLGDQTRERRQTPMGGYRQEKQHLVALLDHCFFWYRVSWRTFPSLLYQTCTNQGQELQPCIVQSNLPK